MSEPQDWIARLTWPGSEGALVLGRDKTWRVEGGGEDSTAQMVVKLARELSQPPLYEYSPAHGWPGYRLAQQVAKTLGAQIELAPVPEPQPGERY